MDVTTKCIEELATRSKSFQFAVAAGLPPKRMYTADETALYLGMGVQELNKEVRDGRLSPFMPAGRARNRRFAVDEVDRWFDAALGAMPSP